MSVRGTFRDWGAIMPDALHEHPEGLRDWLSCLGLGMILLLWLRPAGFTTGRSFIASARARRFI